MNAVEILEEARALLSNRNRWCQEAFAKKKSTSDNFCATDSPEAIAWCSVGAVRKIERESLASSAAIELLDFAAMQNKKWFIFSFRHIVQLNDSCITSHKDVLRAFDLAIKMGKERGLDDRLTDTPVLHNEVEEDEKVLCEVG